MNTNQPTSSKSSGFKEKVKTEAIKAFLLSVYFGAWFCALAFLAATSLRERPIPLDIFGFALIKAALCAKFMLIGQAAYPLHIDKDHGIIPSLFRESLVYLVIVFLLNYLEAGVEGVFHGKEFIASLSAFGQGDPLHILSLSIVYWLIVWPYLLFSGLKLALGDAATLQILFGNPKSKA